MFKDLLDSSNRGCLPLMLIEQPLASVNKLLRDAVGWFCSTVLFTVPSSSHPRSEVRSRTDLPYDLVDIIDIISVVLAFIGVIL